MHRCGPGVPRCPTAAKGCSRLPPAPTAENPCTCLDKRAKSSADGLLAKRDNARRRVADRPSLARRWPGTTGGARACYATASLTWTGLVRHTSAPTKWHACSEKVATKDLCNGERRCHSSRVIVKQVDLCRTGAVCARLGYIRSHLCVLCKTVSRRVAACACMHAQSKNGIAWS